MNKNDKFNNFLKKDGTKSVAASLLCILGGMLVGFVVLFILALIERYRYLRGFLGAGYHSRRTLRRGKRKGCALPVRRYAA